MTNGPLAGGASGPVHLPAAPDGTAGGTPALRPVPVRVPAGTAGAGGTPALRPQLLFCIGRVLAFLVLLSLALAPAHAQNGGSKTEWVEDVCPSEFNLSGTVRGLAGAGRQARVLFHYQDAREYLALDLSAGRAVVSRSKGGILLPLAAGSIPGDRNTVEFSVKRRLWRIAVICNGRIVGRAYDSEVSGGRAGWRAGAGAEVDLRLQAVEPVYFSDDFTRGAGEASEWETLVGRGRVNEVSMGNHGGAVGRYSSNAFSWGMQAQPVALSATGYPFWDDYAVEASVKPEERGAVGMAACVRDARNYLLFRWMGATVGRPRSGSREILCVENGKARVLASSQGGYEPGQWYRLRFIASDGALRAYIDGRLACEAYEEAFGQGRAGLYAENCSAVTFDDVRVVAAQDCRETFGAAEPQKWDDVGSVWQSDARNRCRKSMRPAPGVTVTGRPDWDNYLFAADVRPNSADRVGLCFAYRGPQEHYVFRVPAAAGKASLIRVGAGKVSTLAESAGSVSIGERARLKVEVAGPHVRAYLNDRLVVETLEPAGLAGRIGFFAGGGTGARFGSVVLWFRVEEASKPRLETQFAREETMVGWASGSSSWRADLTGTYWHTGDFYADPQVSLTTPAGEQALAYRLAINADGTSLESGYQLVVTTGSGGDARLELKRRGTAVATHSGEWRVGAENRSLRFWRVGNLIAGRLGDTLGVSFSDPQPLGGTRVGVAAGSGRLDLNALDAASRHMVDCTFSGPPTEWWAGRGVWEVAQRWPCDDRWSFFGGLRSDSPMLWSKQAFAGDITAEAWVALYMDNPDDPHVGYRHPSDLNLSFCGNGKDPSSGYSFLFAAANNTVSRILRQDAVVSENTRVRMVDPRRVNLAFQRHWFHLRAEKHGGRIRFFVDGTPAGEYFDPNPLPGGQVALWTWRNGLMVARARVWYERDGGYVPAPALDAAPADANAGAWKVAAGSPLTVTCDFDNGPAGWAGITPEDGALPALADQSRSQGDRCLRVVNRVSGGDAGVWCGASRFDAARFPVLRFDYRLDRRSRVNLFFRVHGQRMVVVFTAPGSPEPGALYLGDVPNVSADDQWHTAQIDLLATLRRVFPNTASLPVEDLCFRGPNLEYLRSGFGGNPWGAEYRLDNFRLVGAQGATREDAAAVVFRNRKQ